MKRYEITFEDTFSFAVEKRITELTEKQLNSVLHAIESKTIVFSKLVNGIHWNLVPVKIIEL